MKILDIGGQATVAGVQESECSLLTALGGQLNSLRKCGEILSLFVGTFGENSRKK